MRILGPKISVAEDFGGPRISVAENFGSRGFWGARILGGEDFGICLKIRPCKVVENLAENFAKDFF